MKPIVIVGAGGTGEDVAGFLYDINDVGPTYECLGFLDDDPAKQGTCIGGLPVLGPLEQAKEYPEAAFVDCLGSPRTFLQRQERAAELGIDNDRFHDGTQWVVADSAVPQGSATVRWIPISELEDEGTGFRLGLMARMINGWPQRLEILPSAVPPTRP